MLDLKKWIAKITQTLNKSLVGTVSNVYWWSNTWTAPSDGIMVLRITPNSNTWYWYINDTSINAITGSWAHQFRGSSSGAMTYTIPVKKGATYSTAAGSGLGTIQCFFYPMVVGGVVNRLKALQSLAYKGVVVC